MAYSNLKPALKHLQKFAGAVNGEKLLGMTSIGKMLGLGTPGSLERLAGNNAIAPPQAKGKPAAGCNCGTVDTSATLAQIGVAEECEDNEFAQTTIGDGSTPAVKQLTLNVSSGGCGGGCGCGNTQLQITPPVCPG